MYDMNSVSNALWITLNAWLISGLSGWISASWAAAGIAVNLLLFLKSVMDI